MSAVFEETVAALAAVLGAPTDTQIIGWVSKRAAWDITHRRADRTKYTAHVAVAEEERGVIVYAHRVASHRDAAVVDMVIAPSPGLLSRLAARSDRPPLAPKTAAEVFAGRMLWVVTLTSPAVAIECALAIAASEDTPLPGDDTDGGAQ